MLILYRIRPILVGLRCSFAGFGRTAFAHQRVSLRHFAASIEEFCKIFSKAERLERIIYVGTHHKAIRKSSNLNKVVG